MSSCVTANIPKSSATAGWLFFLAKCCSQRWDPRGGTPVVGTLLLDPLWLDPCGGYNSGGEEVLHFIHQIQVKGLKGQNGGIDSSCKHCIFLKPLHLSNVLTVFLLLLCGLGSRNEPPSLPCHHYGGPGFDGNNLGSSNQVRGRVAVRTQRDLCSNPLWMRRRPDGSPRNESNDLQLQVLQRYLMCAQFIYFIEVLFFLSK